MFGHQKAISTILLAAAYSVSACDPTRVAFSDACVCGHNPKVNCEDLARRGNSTHTFATEQCCSDLNKDGCRTDAYGRVHDLADGESDEDSADWFSLMNDLTSWGSAPRTSTWADAKSTPADSPENKNKSTWADAEEEFSADSDDFDNIVLSNGKSTWADAPLGFSTPADEPKGQSTWADAPKIDLGSMNATWNTVLGAVNKANQKVQELRSGFFASAEAYAKALELKQQVENEAEAAARWPLNHSLPPFAQGKAATQSLARGGLAGAQAMLAQLEREEQMKNARRSSVDSRSTEL